MKRAKEKVHSDEALDIKAISKKMESLPRDKLMYVAGAVTALAASESAPPPAGQAS